MITLPNSPSNIVPVYEATTVTRSQTNYQTPEGHLVPSASLQVQYTRTDYVVDADGNRVGTVNRPNPGPEYSGWVSASEVDLPELAAGMVSMEAIDGLIRRDLAKREILAA